MTTKKTTEGDAPSVRTDHEETVTEERVAEARQDLDERQPTGLAERTEPTKTRLRHRLSEIVKRPTVQGATVGILTLVAAVVLIFRFGNAESPPSWYSVSLDFLVPLAAASFLYMLQQGASIRQQEFDKGMLKTRQQHESKLESRKEQLARDLQDEEEKLKKDLHKASRDFLLELEKVQTERQVSVARQRHRLAARLSIADHIGDINGHVSAIDSILTAMSPTEPGETLGPDRSETREMRSETELSAITGSIRIPGRLRRILDMEDTEEE